MTIKNIYDDLKKGFSFYSTLNVDGYEMKTDVLFISDKYIIWQNFGRSAETVSLKNLAWIMTNIFGMRANEFYNTYKKH